MSNKANYNDIIGQRFGKLTPAMYLGDKQYECICDCGNSCEVDRYNLIFGRTQSCGCLVAEQKTRHAEKMGKSNRKNLYCKICGRKHYAKGLCKTCYIRELRRKQREQKNENTNN